MMRMVLSEGIPGESAFNVMLFYFFELLNIFPKYIL